MTQPTPAETIAAFEYLEKRLGEPLSHTENDPANWCVVAVGKSGKRVTVTYTAMANAAGALERITADSLGLNQVAAVRQPDGTWKRLPS